MKNNVSLKRLLSSFLAVVTSFAVIYGSGASVMAGAKAAGSKNLKSKSWVYSNSSTKEKVSNFFKKYSSGIIIGTCAAIAATTVGAIIIAEVKMNRKLDADQMGNNNDLKNNEINRLKNMKAELEFENNKLKGTNETLAKQYQKTQVIDALKKDEKFFARLKNAFKPKNNDIYSNKADEIFDMYNKASNDKKKMEEKLKKEKYGSVCRKELLDIFF